MSPYLTYLDSYANACRTRARDPGVAARIGDLVLPGAERRAAARAMGLAHGLREERLLSKQEVEAEIDRLVE